MNKKSRPLVHLYVFLTAMLLFLPVSARALESPVAEWPSVIAAGDDNYPPYEFTDANGNPAGFNVDLTMAIAEVMGMDVKIRLGPWGDMRKALNNGEVDILQGMAFAEDRTREVDFSPLMRSFTSRSGPERGRRSVRLRICTAKRSSSCARAPCTTSC